MHTLAADIGWEQMIYIHMLAAEGGWVQMIYIHILAAENEWEWVICIHVLRVDDLDKYANGWKWMEGNDVHILAADKG